MIALQPSETLPTPGVAEEIVGGDSIVALAAVSPMPPALK